ncbi:amino acid adenylation domain-containing protein [Nitrococcus mobilis]|uniref:Probable peptide synthetase protein n=1 Tax=Nitrococcus mobilis Nb-231 TaxID=314278 RepID=A4BRH4_9GAMM|nr:non-ribosomal peptide synthetase [Nitrococcus mobilis]EAR21796.1 probable peptide synthetase protein [Nitrococcus mobilis Nb-231]
MITQDEVLLALLRTDEVPAADTIRPRQDNGPAPLSFAQQRLWFLQHYAPEATAYNLTRALRLRGVLDADGLECAFRALIARHAILRTYFEDCDGEPRQIVLPEVPFTLVREDLSPLSEAVREQALKDRIQAEADHPFDLRVAPLLRATLLRLGDEEHVLLLGLHHIVSDAWSNPVLTRDLAAAYRAALVGKADVNLPPLPVQYADYAIWQRECLQGAPLEAAIGYWRDYLGEHLPGLELPTDRSRPARQTSRGGSIRFLLPSTLIQLVQEFCRAEGCTPFVVLLAAWQILLSRYSGQEEFAIGVPNAARGRWELEELVGFFVNTQVYRARLTPGLTVQALCRRLRAEVRSALDYMELPFELLLDRLSLERDPSRSPLFQVMFDLHMQAAPVALSLPGLAVEPIAVAETSAKFDLTLDVVVTGTKAHCELEYNADLFEPTTVARLAGHWCELLRAMLADPERRVGELPMLPKAERFELLDEWNRTQHVYPFARGYVGLFEDRVAEHPQRLAASCQGQDLSYGQLNAQANRLGHGLIAAGVRPDDVVALFAERGLGLLGLIIGVFKAGGGYLPLDPRQPVRRLAQMLDLSRARVVVSTECLRAVLEQALAELPAERRPIWLTLEALSGQDWPVHDPGVRTGPHHLAYVIYTSGSTGVPKGVMVEQAGMLNNQLSKVPYLGLTEGDVIAQTAAAGFDISVWQFLTGLLCGARVEIVPDAIAHDPMALLKHVNATGITVLESVPSLIQGMLAEEAVELKGLRWLLPTGEALAPELARQWFRRYPHIPLVNAYGPAECSDDVALHTLREGPASGTVHLPIGRPTDNTRLYVLDGQLQPVPVGVTGELCIAGAGVGRGYLHDPARTAQAFVPHPYAQTPGERLYRSGDLARWRADGVLEYVGRSDHQVKVRGFRIELGEIEARLLEHQGVREAVVVVREAPSGKHLVGYVVPTALEAGAELGDALKAHLKEAIPEYMVPGQIVVLEQLPLTPNGKLDRKALPEPEWESRDYVAPQTELEHQLAGIWQELLGVKRISMTDDFFALGGHSLLATQVVSRTRKALEIELPLRVLFEASALGSFAERVQQMVAQGRKSCQPPLQAVGRDRPLPLSYAQSRLWFLWQLEPQSSAYNVPGAIRLKGELDIGALGKAFDFLVKRHEVLRTTFHRASGEVIQTVQLPAPIELDREDLGEACARVEERERRVIELAEAEAGGAFDLERGPLLRVRLLRLGAREHVLLVTLHHIVCDAWSMEVLVEEFARAYAAYRQGEAPELAALPIQYADYALWQRQWMEAGEGERQLAYWRAQLGEHHPVLELPTDRARRAVPSERGRRYDFALEAELVQRLRALARAHEVTLPMLLLAAFKVLLYRYTGQGDLRVGVPIANRHRVETEGLIGFFVNTQVWRTPLDGGVRVVELLGRVRETALGAQAHQDLPFEQLVEALQPARSLSHNPLFQVMYNHQARSAAASIELPGLRIEALSREVGSTQFDLTLDTLEEGGGLSAALTYRTELFDHATVARLAGHWCELLRAMLADPERRVGELPMLPKAERFELLAGWNATECVYPFDRGYVGLFERRAHEVPERVAAVFGATELSYGELNCRANRLARWLRAAGVGTDSVVGVCLEREPALLVALLAIHKAGGAYLPIDPALPRARNAYVLEHAAAVLVLTREALRPALQGAERVTALEGLDKTLAELSDRDLDLPVHPRQLAYVLYTSGSTGRPKGVQVEREAFVNFLHAMQDRIRLGSDDRLLAVTTLSFDIAGLELFLPLVQGACVVVARREQALEPAALLGLMQRHGITLMQATPATWQMLVEHEAAAWAGLRVLCGGEALRGELAGRLLARGVRLLNVYGPTETTVWSTAWPVECVDAAVIPIGRPIANTRLYVLDARLEPVPPGVVGELYIGGAGLARGYAQGPALSAAAFVPNPFPKAGLAGAGPGSRLYRTGDLARWRADGVLEYVGRIDHQVKLRGFRVELAEIEVALESLPAVREAVVTAREAPSGKRLVGYVVPTVAPGRAGLTEELQAQLKEALPEYMVPAQLVVLEKLPLTPNGKLDRKALPEPEWESRVYVAPQTELELQLASIWQELLGVKRISMTDDFFALGGHSLLATQAVSRTRKALEIELPLRVLFEASALGSFAERVQQMVAQGRKSCQPPLQAVGRDRPLPLSYAQSRLWFLWQLEPQSAAYNMPGAMRLKGRLDTQALQHTFNALLKRHEGLRTTFRGEDGQPYQIINEATSVEIALEDLGVYPEADRDAAARASAEAEAKAPFDLEAGPLVRVKLLRLAEQDHVLLVTMHHIVSDGWSMNLVIGEFAALYEAYSQGLEPRLPTLPIQYADYALWQRQWMEAGERERQLAYWRAQLGEHHPSLELPSDRPRSALPSHRGANHRFTIDSELTQRLKAFAQAHDVTLFMLLLAAFSIVLKQNSRQSEFLVGTDVANRNRPEIESLVGFFVNQLVLKVSVVTPKMLDFLRSLRSTTLGAFEHQDLPFEQLVEALRPERRSGRAPLFTVKLIYQEIPGLTPMLPNLVTEEFPIARQAAELDLVASFTATGERLQVNFEYSADLFEKKTIVCIGRQTLAVLQRLVVEPDVEVDQLQAVASEIQQAMHKKAMQEQSELMRTLHPIKRRAISQIRLESETNDDSNAWVGAADVGEMPWKR